MLKRMGYKKSNGALLEVNTKKFVFLFSAEIQKMEETIKQLQTAHLQEIESRKAMENDLAQFREDRDRQAAALNEASRLEVSVDVLAFSVL